jgi:hypothetical protein
VNCGVEDMIKSTTANRGDLNSYLKRGQGQTRPLDRTQHNENETKGTKSYCSGSGRDAKQRSRRPAADRL